LTASMVETLARTIDGQSQRAPFSPLVPIQSSGSKTPFFCVHPVGGTTFCYLPLAQWMPKDRPFYGLQAFGVEAGTQPLHTVEEMAGRYVEKIREVQPQGPYLLGGWSMGGVIALEMSRQLTQAGESVESVILFDSSVPGHYPQQSRTEVLRAALDELLALAPEELLRAAAQTLGYTAQDIADDERVLRFLFEVESLQKLHGPEVSYEQYTQIKNVQLANAEALSRYRPSGTFKGRVVMLRASEGASDEASDRAWTELLTTPLETRASDEASDRAWTELLTTPLETHSVAGDHFSLMHSRNLPELARRIAQLLGHR
jgi:thioesterase domain-containing protein